MGSAREVYTARVDGLRAQQVPARASSPSLRLFCEECWQGPGYGRCVAWSDSNLIAYTSLEGLLLGERRTPVFAAPDHPIFIFDAESPQHITALLTPHKAPIRWLEWSPSFIGRWLLACGEDGTVSLWQMGGSIDDWTLVSDHAYVDRGFNASDPVFCAWGSPARRWHQPDPPHETSTAFDAKFLTQPPWGQEKGWKLLGCGCFILVSSLGDVLLWYQQFFGGAWSLIMGKTSGSETPFALADAIIRPDGKLLIVAVETAPSWSLHTYEMELVLSNHPLTSILQELNVTKISCKNLLHPENTVLCRFPSTIAHLRLSVQTPTGNPCLFLVTAGTENTIECELLRLEADLSNSLSWEETHRVTVAPSLMAMDGTMAVWDSMASSSVVTFLELSRDSKFVLLGTWDGKLGKVEVHDSTTLALHTILELPSGEENRSTFDLLKAGVPPKSSPLPVLLSTTTSPMFQVTPTPGQERSIDADMKPSIPVAACMSPNEMCLAVLDFALDLRVFSRAFVYDPQDERAHRALRDRLELAIVAHRDPWDLIVHTRAHAESEGEFQLPGALVNLLSADYKSLGEERAVCFRRPVEVITTYLYRASSMREIGVLESQGRLFMSFILERFRHTLPDLVSEDLIHSSDPIPFCESFSRENINRDVVSSLVPFVHWCYGFVALILRCLLEGLPTLQTSEAGEGSSFWYDMTNILPDTQDIILGASFVQEMSALEDLLRIILYARCVASLLPPAVLADAPFGCAPYTKDNITTLVEILRNLRTVVAKSVEGTAFVQQIMALPTSQVISHDHHEDVLRVLNAGGTLEPILQHGSAWTTLCFLDLLPRSEGFLDRRSRPWGRSGPLDRPGESGGMMFDVLTRKKIEVVQRRCTRCGRGTTLPGHIEPSTTSQLGADHAAWINRWHTACPICGGLWRAV